MEIPKWENKCWGKVLHCFQSPFAAVSILEVEKGYRCSRHYHKERVNQFTVVSGRLLVERMWNGNPFCAEDLGPGDSCTVPVGQVHRFRVLESGVVVEVYYPFSENGTVRLDDIVREDEGGPDEA